MVGINTETINFFKEAMKMVNLKRKFSICLFVLPLLVSLASAVAAVEAEFSRVTLFVEGMMKSSGGVT